MLVLAPVVLSILLVPLLGGRLGRLADLELRSRWLLVLALGAQILIISVVPEAHSGLLAVVHVATYAVAGIFVWRNRSVPGLLLLGAGAAANGVTIAANGGVLPASATALERSGFQVDPGEFTNSGVLPDPALLWLGDVLWVPASWPLSNVFSIGDILIVTGMVWGVHRICGSRLGGRRPIASAEQPGAVTAEPVVSR